MIDETDRDLLAWVGEILEHVEVSLAPPGPTELTERTELADPAQKEVRLYLMDLVQSAPARGSRRPPLLMTLRYLVTTHAAEPREAHQLLGRLAIAALENPEFEVEHDPLPVSLWTAFGIPPRPAFVLRVPFRHERPEKLAPLVKKPLVIKQLPLHSFAGRILGPENIPLMNARVDLPALELSTNTDSQGRFHFSSVPAAPGGKLLRVRARGKEFSINTEQAGSDKEPLVIHLQLEG